MMNEQKPKKGKESEEKLEKVVHVCVRVCANVCFYVLCAIVTIYYHATEWIPLFSVVDFGIAKFICSVAEAIDCCLRLNIFIYISSS